MPYTPKNQQEKEEILARIKETVEASGFSDGVSRGFQAGMEEAARIVDEIAAATERGMRQAKISRREQDSVLNILRTISAGIRSANAERSTATAA